RHVKPGDLLCRDSDYAGSSGGVYFARLRIGKRRDDRIESCGIVDELELLHSFAVQLPKRDVLSVRTPSPSVPAEQLFFVDPVKGAVYKMSRAVGRKLRDVIAAQILDIDVVLADVADAPAIRRKLCEHKRRGLCISTELSEPPACEIKHPVVAASIASPNPSR